MTNDEITAELSSLIDRLGDTDEELAVKGVLYCLRSAVMVGSAKQMLDALADFTQGEIARIDSRWN